MRGWLLRGSWVDPSVVHHNWLTGYLWVNGISAGTTVAPAPQLHGPWIFCEENPVAYDPNHIDSVGPTAKLIYFFKDVVLKRAYFNAYHQRMTLGVQVSIGSAQATIKSRALRR